MSAYLISATEAKRTGADARTAAFSWSRPIAVAIFALSYCLVFLLLRVLLSQTIAVDDVEQLIAVQELRLGYRAAQPPLHGWLLWLASQVFGPGLAALLLVKYGLLFGTLLVYYGAARRLTTRDLYAALATLSLTLIFLIGYKLHRGYTHTAALMFGCAATLYLFVLLRERRSLLLYALFGLAVGLGLLAKYNFIAFLVALLIAGLATPAWRPVLLNARSLLSLAVCIAVVAPTAVWLAAEAPVSAATLAASRLPDVASGFLAVRLAGLGQALRSALEFLLPFILVVPLAFPVLRLRLGWKEDTSGGRATAWRQPGVRLLAIQALAGLGFLLLVVAISGTSAFKARHLHPLLMFVPILVFLVIDHLDAIGAVSARALRRGARLVLVMAVAAILGTAASLAERSLRPAPDCGSCRLQRPYPALGAYLRERHGIAAGTLIAGDEFIGGNLRAALPGLRVYSLPYDDVTPPPADRPAAHCLVVWDASDGVRMPGALAAWVARVRGLADARNALAEEVVIPYPHGSHITHGFRTLLLPPAGDCY